MTNEEAKKIISKERDGLRANPLVKVEDCLYEAFDVAIKALEQEPSAQPEIVRCSQCKYAEVADSEDSQDGYTCQFHRGSIWFSGSYCSWAKRLEEEYVKYIRRYEL